MIAATGALSLFRYLTDGKHSRLRPRVVDHVSTIAHRKDPRSVGGLQKVVNLGIFIDRSKKKRLGRVGSLTS